MELRKWRLAGRPSPRPARTRGQTSRVPAYDGRRQALLWGRPRKDKQHEAAAVWKGWSLAMVFLRTTRIIWAAAVLALLLSACLPGAGPRLRIIHGQTWAANFDVRVTPSNSAGFTLPVSLELTFNQRF